MHNFKTLLTAVTWLSG